MSTAIRKEDGVSGTGEAALLSSVDRENSPAQDAFINREFSLLEFHRRVLEEAFDETNPLLERLKFLSIFASNLDEFFMIRVSGLKEAVEQNVTQLSLDWLTPAEQLAELRKRLLPIIEQQMNCLREDLLRGIISSAKEGA